MRWLVLPLVLVAFVPAAACGVESTPPPDCTQLAVQAEGLPSTDAVFSGRGGGAEAYGEVGLRAAFVLRRRAPSEMMLFIFKNTLPDAVIGRAFTFGVRFDASPLLAAAAGERITLTSDLRTTVADGAECDATVPVSVDVEVVEAVGRFDAETPAIEEGFLRAYAMTFAWRDTGCGLASLSGRSVFTLRYASFSQPCGAAGAHEE